VLRAELLHTPRPDLAGRHYAPSRDGQRFLIDAADDNEPINVVVNWTALLPAE